MIPVFRNLWFALQDSSKNIVKIIISSFGILFLISFLVLYISFRDSMKNYIETNLFGKLTINEIKIFPRAKVKNKLFTAGSALNGRIHPNVIATIKGMRELAEVYTVIKMDYETKVRVEMMGEARRIHLPVCGISRTFFRGKDPNWSTFSYSRNAPVPVVAPRFVLELLNNWLSVTGIPTMTQESMRGFPIKIFTYTNPPNADKKDYEFEAEVHSFTDIFTFPGVIVPPEFITRFAKEHRMESGRPLAGYTYVMVYAKVKDIKQLPTIASKLRALGLDVESQDDIAKKTNEVLDILDQSSLVIIGILLILTVISIFNSYLTIVYTRSQKFSLKRVLGVSKLSIVFNFVVESALVGAFYGIIGFFLGNHLLHYFARSVPKWVPALKGMTIQPADTGILLLAILLSALISSVSALIPAIFASNINLFKAIRK